MTVTDLQERVLAVIIERKAGSEITGKQIAEVVEMKDRHTGKEGADLRSVVNALRDKGYPVCANSNGYYWPQSKEELTQYLASFQARIDEQQNALEGMRNGFDKVGINPFDVLKELPRPTVYKI